MDRSAEMKLRVASLRHEDDPRIDTAVLAVRVLDIVGEDPRLEEDVAPSVSDRRTQTAFEAERIGKGRALDKGRVQAAGQFLERLEVVVLPDRDFERTVLIAQDGVGDGNLVACEIYLELVAEPSGHVPRSAQAGAAQFAAEAVAGPGRRRGAGETCIDHQTAAGLEAPAVGLGEHGDRCGCCRLCRGGRSRHRRRGGTRCLQLGFELVDTCVHGRQLHAHGRQIFVRILREQGCGGSAAERNDYQREAGATGHRSNHLIRGLRNDDATMTAMFQIYDIV